MTVQSVGAVAGATSALAQDVTQHETLTPEAQELRTWLGSAAGVPSILAPGTTVPSTTGTGRGAPSAPTEMQTLMTPDTPLASTKMDLLL